MSGHAIRGLQFHLALKSLPRGREIRPRPSGQRARRAHLGPCQSPKVERSVNVTGAKRLTYSFRVPKVRSTARFEDAIEWCLSGAAKLSEAASKHGIADRTFSGNGAQRRTTQGH